MIYIIPKDKLDKAPSHSILGEYTYYNDVELHMRGDTSHPSSTCCVTLTAVRSEYDLTEAVTDLQSEWNEENPLNTFDTQLVWEESTFKGFGDVLHDRLLTVRSTHSNKDHS